MATLFLDKGVDVDTIDVNTKLSVMKPIHAYAKWRIDHPRNKAGALKRAFELAEIDKEINVEI